MGRPKGSKNKKTLEREKLQFVPATEKPKRHRRTKSEMEAFRQSLQEKKEQKQKKSEKSYWDSCPPMKTLEDICDEQIQQAIDEGREDAYEDLRNDFERGNIVYLVDYNPLMQTLTQYSLQVFTVYAKVVVCYNMKGNGEFICFSLKDSKQCVFKDPRDARTYYNKLKETIKINNYI